MSNIKFAVRRNRNLLILHLTVFVWGFTGILGALISISATQLVWYRVLIALASLGLWFKLKKIDYRINRVTLLKLVLTGGLVGLHWILFFYSIKVSTVSVTLICLSSLTLFTAILEPLISKKQISKMEVLTGLCIISGICLIFKFETGYTTGIATGLASALCASIFSIINSKLVKKHVPALISFYELAGAWAWISIYLLATGDSKNFVILQQNDIVYLILLGTICTSVAYVAGVSVMKELSAFRVALITNLEPIYGIVLAFVFFGKKEQMSIGFYAGATLIISSIFLYPYLKKQMEKTKKSK